VSFSLLAIQSGAFLQALVSGGGTNRQEDEHDAGERQQATPCRSTQSPSATIGCSRRLYRVL
jgi:hypothetical protein